MESRGKTPAVDVSTQIMPDCGTFCLDLKDLTSHFLPQTLGALVLKNVQNWLWSEERSLDHSTTAQFHYSLVQVKSFWHGFWFRKSLMSGMWRCSSSLKVSYGWCILKHWHQRQPIVEKLSSRFFLTVFSRQHTCITDMKCYTTPHFLKEMILLWGPPLWNTHRKNSVQLQFQKFEIILQSFDINHVYMQETEQFIITPGLWEQYRLRISIGSRNKCMLWAKKLMHRFLCAFYLGFLFLDREVEVKLCWDLTVRLHFVWEVNSPYSTVRMDLREKQYRNWSNENRLKLTSTLNTHADLYTCRLNVIGSIGPLGDVCHVYLNLVPAIIQFHGHGADKWLHSCCCLIVTRPKSPTNIFFIQHLKVLKSGGKAQLSTDKWVLLAIFICLSWSESWGLQAL